MNHTSPIRFNEVSFSYSKQEILKSFNFEIPDNEFIGMIGVNGSGKSTLLKLMLGLLKPQQGDIKVLEQTAGSWSTKSKVSSALQDIDFPSSENVEEILSFVCAQYEKSAPIKDLIDDFQLSEFTNKSCGQLSGGMKRRLALACAFAGHPKVVLLDEPTTGLDKDSRAHLVQNLKKYQQNNQALVIMISHHPEEVMDLVDEFYHLKNGSIAPVSTEQMKNSTRLRKLSFETDHGNDLPASLNKIINGKEVIIVTDDSDKYVANLVQNNVKFKNLMIDKLGMDELLGDFL